ncbi:MAG TPA: alpha/beta fold hydrolase [Polyangia bacterium]|nr:alpha/beta fold hydrolase [Polyangia bacterium]
MTSESSATAAAGLPPLFAEPARLLRRMLNAPALFEAARETRVGTSPAEVVLAEGTHRLLHYRRPTPAAYAEPVLFCYALVNRPTILDLQPDKSVVQQYLRAGFEVYLIDWGVPGDADHTLTLEHYVDGFLARAAAAVLDRHGQGHGGDRLHLLGYCMGGTMAALHTALRPERIASLTLLAAPIDFAGQEALLNLWTDPRHFDVDALVDAYGNCPAWFLQTCFLLMNPVANLLEKNVALYEQMDEPRNLAGFFALERWVNDNIPVAGETFRRFVKDLYQRNLLVKGELRLGGARVDLGRIACPLLLLTAKNDHLVAPAATEGIRPHVAARDVASMEMAAGHVGLVVSGRAHRSFWPAATTWLGERSTRMGAVEPRTRSEEQ